MPRTLSVQPVSRHFDHSHDGRFCKNDYYIDKDDGRVDEDRLSDRERRAMNRVYDTPLERSPPAKKSSFDADNYGV